MIFCEQCGTKVNDDEQFCSGCGKKVVAEQTIAPLAAVPQPSAQVTNVSSKVVKRVCGSCNKELEQDWIVCPYCITTETKPKLCVNCKKKLEQDWLVCPFCNTAV